MLRYLTAGESHGPVITAILEGIPAGLSLKVDDINPYLYLRQQGYGRGGRMHIEKDKIQIVSGVRFGKTLGSPITLQIKNLDWVHWVEIMSTDPNDETHKKEVVCPRPGHADLAGGIKYAHHDLRNVLERASARETALRVALGAVARKLLSEFGMTFYSYVTSIGGVHAHGKMPPLEKLTGLVNASPCRTFDASAEKKMKAKIHEARKKGNTVGGTFEVLAMGVPAGLGSYVQWDRKLDGRLAMAMMSIQAIKGVEIGLGMAVAEKFGSEVHDAIYYSKAKGYYYKTNRCGGLTGGVTTGAPLLVRAAMKPISTLLNPLDSVDVLTKKPAKASTERSDFCAVPAASVVGEAVVAYEVAGAFLEKFGGDSLEESRRNYQGYLKQVKHY